MLFYCVKFFRREMVFTKEPTFRSRALKAFCRILVVKLRPLRVIKWIWNNGSSFRITMVAVRNHLHNNWEIVLFLLPNLSENTEAWTHSFKLYLRANKLGYHNFSHTFRTFLVTFFDFSRPSFISFIWFFHYLASFFFDFAYKVILYSLTLGMLIKLFGAS